LKRNLLAMLGCVLLGLLAWRLATWEGRIDADEKVAVMLPGAEGEPWVALPETLHAIGFAAQATLGAAMLWLGYKGVGRRG
jgi:hypothetical protein